MKRIALIAVMLIGGVVGARADRDIRSSTSGHPRGDAALQADISTCNMLLGAPQNGEPTSREYKRCMLSHGWRFSHTVRERSSRSGFYPDPDNPGMTCRSFKIGDVTGSECSNVW